MHIGGAAGNLVTLVADPEAGGHGRGVWLGATAVVVGDLALVVAAVVLVFEGRETRYIPANTIVAITAPMIPVLSRLLFFFIASSTARFLA